MGFGFWIGGFRFCLCGWDFCSVSLDCWSVGRVGIFCLWASSFVGGVWIFGQWDGDVW